MKNIVIVTGSPRQGSNSTILAKAFAAGAEEAGHNVDIFDSVKNKVEGCIACKKCWSKGRPCVFEDGFNVFGKLLEQSDAVVFATPVYWGTYPAQMKALVDKFFAYGIKRTKVDIRCNKKFVLLACGDGQKETAFVNLTKLCESFTEFLQWDFAGAVTVPELVDEREILGMSVLEEAKELGRTI